MSGFPRSRTLTVRSRVALASVAAACAALTGCQAPIPIVTAADGNAHNPTGQHRAPGDPNPHTTPTTSPTTSPTTLTTTQTTTAVAIPPPTDANPNPNCTLIVPPAPLSAAGLATPYRFVATNPGAGACHEANPDQSAFVEAAILDPATGAISRLPPAGDRRRDAARRRAGPPQPAPRWPSSGSGSASRPTT